MDVIDTSGPVSSSDLEMLNPLPAVTDRRKTQTQFCSMIRVSVFRDCGDDTLIIVCFQKVDISIFTDIN